MVTQGANVRRGVVVFSSLFVTVQFFAIAGTVAFYFVASSPNKYRDPVTKGVLRSLYFDPEYSVRSNAILKHLRRSHGLEVKPRFKKQTAFLSPRDVFSVDTSLTLQTTGQ